MLRTRDENIWLLFYLYSYFVLLARGEGKNILVGRFSGVWNQSVLAISWIYARVVEVRAFPVFALNSGIRLTNEEKLLKLLCQGTREVSTWTVLGTIISLYLTPCYVLPLLTCWPQSRLRLGWLGWTFGQCKYLTSCWTKMFPTSANAESKISVRAPNLSANVRTPEHSEAACHRCIKYNN